jgi:hypothetical protein
VKPTNGLALVSLMAAILTIVSFCIGFAPFLPLTAILCYPAASLLGLAALLTGVRSLRQMRLSGEGGRALAWIGICTGGLAILAVILFTTLTVLLLYFGIDSLQNA